MDDGLLKEILAKVIMAKESKKILILLTGANSYVKEILDILKGYHQHSFVYLMSKNAESIHQISEWDALGRRIFTVDEAHTMLAECHMLLIPFLTRNLLAKASVGIADDPTSTILQTSLMMGKEVLAIDSCCNPDSEYNKLLKLNQNNAYHAMLLKHKSVLASFGVTFVPVFEFPDKMKSYMLDSMERCSIMPKDTSCSSEESNFITCKDLIGKETFHIPSGAKLTDLAKDYIHEKNISLQ